MDGAALECSTAEMPGRFFCGLKWEWKAETAKTTQQV